MNGVKDKIMNLLKTNTTKDHSKSKHMKNFYGVEKEQSKLEKQKYLNTR